MLELRIEFVQEIELHIEKMGNNTYQYYPKELISKWEKTKTTDEKINLVFELVLDNTYGFNEMVRNNEFHKTLEGFITNNPKHHRDEVYRKEWVDDLRRRVRKYIPKQ